MFFILRSGIAVERRRGGTLESCGAVAGVACKIVAVDDVFVVPVADHLEARRLLRGRRQFLRLRRRREEEVARKLADASGGWNAVAVGAAGRPGLALKASSEQSRGQRGARQLRQARQRLPRHRYRPVFGRAKLGCAPVDRACLARLGRCPLCADSNQIPRRIEVTRCAIRGHERSYQLVGGRRRWWWGSRKPSHPQQALQDLRTASKAIRLRLIGSVAPSVARVRIFLARHAITEDVRSASGTVWAASFRTPLNKAQRSVGGESASQRPWRYSKKTLLTKMKKIGGRRGAATLTKTITTSWKTGGPDPLNAFHSFGKLR